MKKQLALLTLALLPSLSAPALATDLPLDTPTEDFTINNDGTVTHKKTGLSWQRCSVGQTWDGSNCYGTAQSFTWDDAVKNYDTDCNGWRLPRIDELNTITEHGKVGPAINSTIFPNTPSIFYWSTSSADGYYPNYKWGVYFYSGNTTYDDKSRSYYSARLVRGGNACSFDTFTPTSDFIDNNDGTVTHKKTNLMWQRCLFGQSWDGKSCTGFSSIFNQGESRTQTDTFAGYSDWRLPTLSELNTIVDYANYSPAANKDIFPIASPELGDVWTSSIGANNPDFGWIVHFLSGYTSSGDYRANAGGILFVRAPTATGTVDLTAAVEGSPNPVTVNQNLTYTGTVTNNGNATATGTTLIFKIVKPSMTFVSAPKSCVNKGVKVVCSIGDLAAKNSITKNIIVTMKKVGAVSLKVEVKSKETDVDVLNNKATNTVTIKK
ncbi:MAG: DUF1566 domain-containing protein [Methylobacter sp.]|nr:MAG: DUF1566 domain-containing protein [Methylobacter sp.]